MTREQGRLVCTWGGNVRELKRLVCMVVLHTEGNAVTADFFRGLRQLLVVLHTEGNAVTADALEFNEMPLAADASLALDDMEEKQIIHVLEQAKGNRTLAVELLGIGRTMLYNKIRLYDIKYKE